MRKSNHGKVTFVDVILLIVFMFVFVAVIFVAIQHERARRIQSDSSRSAYIIESLDETTSSDSASELTETTTETTTATETTTDITTTSESKSVFAVPAVTSVPTTTTDKETDQSTDKKTEETAKNSTTHSSKSTTSTITTTATTTANVVVKNSAVGGKYYTEQDVIDIAKVLYRECGCLPSKTEQACVVWTILNRVDYYEKSIHDIIRAPYQYTYRVNSPVKADLYELAWDVLERWSREKDGETYVGRVLPRDYMWFWGDGRHNHFRNSYTRPYRVWDYSLGTPYDS